MLPKYVDRMINSLDSDQKHFDLSLQCLFRSLCPNTRIFTVVAAHIFNQYLILKPK